MIIRLYSVVIVLCHIFPCICCSISICVSHHLLPSHSIFRRRLSRIRLWDQATSTDKRFFRGTLLICWSRSEQLLLTSCKMTNDTSEQLLAKCATSKWQSQITWTGPDHWVARLCTPDADSKHGIFCILDFNYCTTSANPWRVNLFNEFSKLEQSAAE